MREAHSLEVIGSHLVTQNSASLEIKQNHKGQIRKSEINRIFGAMAEPKDTCLALGFSVDASRFIPLTA